MDMQRKAAEKQTQRQSESVRRDGNGKRPALKELLPDSGIEKATGGKLKRGRLQKDRIGARRYPFYIVEGRYLYCLEEVTAVALANHYVPSARTSKKRPSVRTIADTPRRRGRPPKRKPESLTPTEKSELTL